MPKENLRCCCKVEVQAISVIAGIITIAPKPGECVLVKYAGIPAVEEAEFHARGDEVVVGYRNAAEGLSPAHKLIAKITGNDRVVKKLKMPKTGFYRCYPECGKGGEDVYELIDARNIECWMRIR